MLSIDRLPSKEDLFILDSYESYIRTTKVTVSSAIQPMAKWKLNDVWAKVTALKPEGLSEINWRRSYMGVKAALTGIGLTLETTEAEFCKLPVPTTNGCVQ